MVSQDLIELTARSGAPSIKVGGKPYHSVYDPLREAQMVCASANVEGADVVFLFGWGLGYGGQVLRARLKAGARVFVFEPNAELFGLSRGHETFDDRRFRFVVGDRIASFFSEWNLEGCGDTDRFLWIEWPAAAALNGGLLEELKAQFRTRLRDKAANLLTHFQRGSLYFENAIANFRYQDSADAGRLFGTFKGIPLVIVSAGPSLDLNIGRLGDAADRCFLLAVDTALRPLLAAGVTPHAVMVADPSALNARHVAGVVPESTYLIGEQGVQPAALESARRRFLFGLGLFPDPLFAKYGFAKSSLEVWGSVATGALDLACRIGADPVILVGQDFGFSWGREYASHTVFHGNAFSAELGGPLREPDIYGNPVHTTENLIAYRDHFVRRIRQRQDIRFINATEGGILREAVEIVPLKHALAQHCRKSVDVAARLSRAAKPHAPSLDALKHFLHVLESRRNDCGCLSSFLELTARQQILNNDSSGIDERIRWGIEKTAAVLA